MKQSETIPDTNTFVPSQQCLLVSGEDKVRRELILKILSLRGYVPDVEEDIRHVLKQSKNIPYKVIILDIAGFTRDPCPMLKQIKENFPETHLVIFVDQNLIYKYSGELESQTDKQLTNPINPRELLDTVESYSKEEEIHNDESSEHVGTIEKEEEEHDDVVVLEPKGKVAAQKVIAIGGGKGGVGKSVIAANLAASLALRGKRVIAIDVDLGGPNLHTYFGIKRLKGELFDFLLTKDVKLSDIVCPTKIDNLSLIGVTKNAPGAANIHADQKLRFMNHVKMLEADYIVFDLGSGTTHNVIDFFSFSKKGIIVTTPEITSILNTYTFVKSMFYREIENIFRVNQKKYLVTLLKESAKPEMQIKTMKELEQQLVEEDFDAKEMIEHVKKRFQPGLIVNMGNKSVDNNIGYSIRDIVKKHLDLDIDYFGMIYRDQKVEASVRSMFPFLLRSPTCPAAVCLKGMVPKIVI